MEAFERSPAMIFTPPDFGDLQSSLEPQEFDEAFLQRFCLINLKDLLRSWDLGVRDLLRE